jgi:biotin carboxylase
MHDNNKIDLLILPPVENIQDITKNMNVNVTTSYYSNLEFIFKDNEVSILYKGRDINTFSAVWLSSHWSSRELATAVKQYLDFYNIPNTYTETSTSKVTDSVGFSLSSLQCPDTYYVRTSRALSRILNIEKVCGYPMIMKRTKGFGGKNAEFINSRKELSLAIKHRNKKYQYMFQQFIENDYDWGVMVVNGKVVSGEKSYAKDGEFKNNAIAGAKEVFTELEDIPEEIQEMAISGARSLGLFWSRSDIIVDKYTNKPYLLEVNRFPGITKETTEVAGATEFISTYLDINGLLPKEVPGGEIIPLAN